MPTNPLGNGVTRFLETENRSLSSVVFQAGKPPLDSELNLISALSLQGNADEVKSRVASGWLMDVSNTKKTFKTHPSYSNYFYFGNSQDASSITYAVVNGWVVPVVGTWTGTPPQGSNDSEFWNKILLDSPSANGTVNFVFLEVWNALLDNNTVLNTNSDVRPAVGMIHRYGNVQGGFTPFADQMIDEDMNFETSKRTQIQYRIRVVTDVNLVQYPEGFYPGVNAQGPNKTSSTLAFANMGSTLGDPGLWRAGDAQNTLNTVDGYVYAIPLCGVNRRSTSSWSSTAMMGGFNRNPNYIKNAASAKPLTSSSLASQISASDTSFALNFDVSTKYEMQSVSTWSGRYIQVGSEILSVSGVVVNGTTSTFTVGRGALNSVAQPHPVGTRIKLLSGRPDGLFADQVAKSDIIDLRHAVSDKFDYDTILKTNVLELMRGNLNTAFKTANTARGSNVFCCDEITGNPTSNPKLDIFDGKRRAWSDAVVTQRFVVSCVAPQIGQSIGNKLNSDVVPYTIDAVWENAHTSKVQVASRGVSGIHSWFNGDVIRIKKNSFTSSSLTADQVRFVIPTASIPDAVFARFEGTTSDPNGIFLDSNDLLNNAATIQSATLPVTQFATSPVMKNAADLTVETDPSNGDLLIYLNGSSGNPGDVLSQWADAKTAVTVSLTNDIAKKILLHIEFTVAYGSGRGLSKKPDFIHAAQITSSNSLMLRRPGAASSTSPLLPTYIGDSPYCQTGNDRQYAKTSEYMVDLGSKTVYLAPYKRVNTPSVLLMDGDKTNWYLNQSGDLVSQKLMPQNNLNGNGSDPQNPNLKIYPVVDPLELFARSSPAVYAEIPFTYLPKPGLHYAPINNGAGSLLPTGLNFLLNSSSGTTSYNSDYNKTFVSYPSSAAGYYIITPYASENVPNKYGTTATTGASCYGKKVTISRVSNSEGKPFKGIVFPPYYGPARITGVYARTGSNNKVPDASAFTSLREPDTNFTGTNLLKKDFNGPTYLLDVNIDGDVTFVLNSECLDLSYDNFDLDTNQFMVECTLFGFDRGFLQTNGRIVAVKGTTSGNFAPETAIGLITPAPLVSNDSVKLFYTRSPYQGDIYNPNDDTQRVGPISYDNVADIKSGLQSRKTIATKKGFQVLSSLHFVTSMGTGRISGPRPIPILDQTLSAPTNPPDFEGSLVDLHRRFSLNRVGYEDWALRDPDNDNTNNPHYKFPILMNPDEMPFIATGALSERFDDDVLPEFMGSTTQLPLGAYFRDKDFVGKTLYGSRSVDDVANISYGTLAFVPHEISLFSGNPGKSTFEGEDFDAGKSNSVVGSGVDSIVLTDATSDLTQTEKYRVTRGAAGYAITNSYSGGAIASKLPRLRPNSEVGSVLNCAAYLVRSVKETSNSVVLNPGNELQMIIVTQAFPSYMRESEIVHCSNGLGEGFSAVERYRIAGRPIENSTTLVDTTIEPNAAPLFVNKVYNDPLYYGSSDISQITTKSEKKVVSGPSDTGYDLLYRPLNKLTVQVFLNGLKLNYGDEFDITGNTDQSFTYLDSTIPLKAGDVFSFWYVAF